MPRETSQERQQRNELSFMGFGERPGNLLHTDGSAQTLGAGWRVRGSCIAATPAPTPLIFEKLSSILASCPTVTVSNSPSQVCAGVFSFVNMYNGRGAYKMNRTAIQAEKYLFFSPEETWACSAALGTPPYFLLAGYNKALEPSRATHWNMYNPVNYTYIEMPDIAVECGLRKPTGAPTEMPTRAPTPMVTPKDWKPCPKLEVASDVARCSGAFSLQDKFVSSRPVYKTESADGSGFLYYLGYFGIWVCSAQMSSPPFLLAAKSNSLEPSRIGAHEKWHASDHVSCVDRCNVRG
jgi:hypothetical protein